MKFLALITFLYAVPAQARDWFVRADSSGGDGSQAKPFADPWQALEKCEAGDAIHVAEGKYYGRNRLGYWKIPFDNVQLLGGYDHDFKTRNPWQHKTELLWDKESKNWPKDERLSSTSKNVTVDGFILDMQDQCEYQDPERTGRREKPCESAMRFALPATVKNNVIVNPGENGITACAESVIENNLIINAVVWGVVINKHGAHTNPATIKNNTILFSWSFSSPAKGKYDGSALAIKSPAVISNNILAHNDNNGVYMPMSPETVALTGNVFHMNHWSNVKQELNAKEAVADDKSMDLLEDMGFKSYDGNVVKDPGLALDAKWMDQYVKRTAAIPGKVDMDEWNKARQTLGLPLLGKGYKSATGVAPPYAVDKALKLMAPKVPQGAHIVQLPVKFSGAVAAAPQRDYKQVEPSAWVKSPTDGQAYEMVVGVAGVANLSGLPKQFDPNQHAGVKMYDKTGNDWFIAFYKKGSAAQREVDAAGGWYQGSGKPERLFTVKGISYTLSGIPKAGLFVESVQEAGTQAQATAADKRPVGRDWFVRAGSAGGDGSKEKPFKDPWQALEKAGTGDNVHVAEGEYNGKLKAGAWTIKKPYVALLGGYDKDFKARNPWKHPTVLRTSPELKTYNSDYIVQGDEDHTGAVVDGFVFDKTPNNKYKANGDLDYDNSTKMPHIWFARPGCVIRNNVFVNSTELAIRAAGGQTLENNIFMNSHMIAVRVEAGYGGLVTIKNNTFAHAWNFRFGQGKGSSGTLLVLEGRVQAVVDHNIFEFADNDAIKLNTDARDVTLTNNTFAHNLWSHVQRSEGWVTVDDKTWKNLADLGFKKLEGNQLMTAGLPVDKKWMDVYINRTAYTPGKVTMDDWNHLREILGQPLVAKGGQPGSGLAPNYKWQDAMQLFPKNAKCTAGARAKDLPVQFAGA